MAVLRLYLLALFLAYAKCSSYVFSNTIVLDSQGNYNVSYNFNESADTLEFMVEVRATGWVGFGFALNAPNNMTGYDVAIGGVLNNGTGYIKDYLTNGFPNVSVGPPLDSEQNWHLTNSTEQNGVTTLKFYRKRNTTDANDIAIEQGTPIFIVWAYASSDVEPGQFGRHDSRGFRPNVTLIPDAAVTTMVSAVSTSTSAMAAITTSIMAAMTTSTLASMGASSPPAVTTSTLASMSASTPAAVTTSTLASMSASTPPAVTTSTLTAMNTSVIAPSTTTPVVSSSSVVMPTPTPVKPKHFANFVSLDNGKYNASWMFDIGTGTLHFMVEVRATGWVGFGVATQAPTNMVGYDVAVGGVSSGSGYLKDYFTSGRSTPPEDSQQDWMLSYSSEENGVTTLRFYRKQDTNDRQNDVVIQQGVPMFLIWAYHSTSDVQPGQFPRHSFQGVRSEVTLIPEMPQFTRSFDDNRFVLMWRFDDQSDMIYYHLRVKTTGWVGFGFAEKAPNSMMDYDVIVAGYSNGQGYLWDFKTIGRRLPALDESQDYKLLNASEVDGYTELMFERRPDTKDTNDLAFTPGGEVNIIWAYSASDANDPGTFGVHSKQGWSEKVVIVTEQPIPTDPSAASTLCSGIYGIVTLTITLLNVLLL